MDPRLAKAEGLFLPLLPTAPDAAFGGWLSRAAAGIGAVAVAIWTWPDRRAAYERLRGYTDRQLADIGLTRGDLPRVFEPGFAHEPANDTSADRKAA